MNLLSILLLALGLAMDAFAVSLCKGLSIRGSKVEGAVVAGLWFGGFQAIMPVLGYILGSSVYELVSDYAPWVAFLLLTLVGTNMIWESFGKKEHGGDMSVAAMLPLAVATSIDAFITGISLAMGGGGIALPAAVIGIITFALSAVGIYAGGRIGERFGNIAGCLGGVILIFIGLNVLFADGISF